MPNYVSFVSKKTGQEVILNHLDEELAALVGEEVHPRHYCRSWFDIIGFRAASGKSLDEIRDEIIAYEADEADDEKELTAIAKHLAENYTTNAWAGLKIIQERAHLAEASTEDPEWTR
jgi:hypothetical protein